MQGEPKTTASIQPVDTNTNDAGKVRLGGMSPSLTPVRVAPIHVADTGKVRLGGMAPTL